MEEPQTKDKAKSRIEKFEDLRVWQEAQNWAVEIYKITRSFPDDEKFGLTSQLRRAASSVSANIAEGFGRRTNKDKLQFYVIAYGSALEAKNFLYLSNKLNYIDETSLTRHIDRGTAVQRLLNAFMGPLKSDV